MDSKIVKLSMQQNVLKVETFSEINHSVKWEISTQQCTLIWHLHKFIANLMNSI